ncbi:MAG: L,D-transpeptidase family protein [Hyphomicrobiales bacterium]
MHRPLDELIVTQVRGRQHRGVLKAGPHSIPCALGPPGLIHDKREGDGATPVGTWPMRCVFYRPDRTARPRTALPVHRIKPDDGWCDAPDDRCYNRPVTLPYPASAETLWRDDHLYDLMVVLGHNDAPVRPGFGSCIFFHLMRLDGGPTEGCVAIPREDMLKILERCGPHTVMQTVRS